jgi:5-formyltetrahydrofolate cyclo-ligase
MSIRSEISTNKLNKAILDMDKKLAFPTIEKNAESLVFKTTNSDKSFKLGKFNIPEPTNDNKEIIPQLFFVPCLGFDLRGYRIGYGGGFYDKTFEKLKKLDLLFYTVGFAYDEQKLIKLPIEKFDYKLDFVLTEKQLYTFL